MKITPEMIAAGVDAWRENGGQYEIETDADLEEIIKAIFEAMAALSPDLVTHEAYADIPDPSEWNFNGLVLHHA